MDNAKAQQQIQTMISFILSEAREKADEINIQGQNERSLKASKLVQAESEKVRKEFDRRKTELELKQRINHSTSLNKARLDKLRAQQKEVQNVFAAARTKLPSLTTSEGYGQLLGRLILQGLVNMDQTDVVLRVRAEDVSLAQKILPSVVQEYKEKFMEDKSRQCSVTVDAQHTVKCTGGVVLSGLDGRILCNNTLDMRLVFAYEASLPRLRHTLFGSSPF